MTADIKLLDGSRVTVDAIERPLAWQLLGLQFSASGYGRKIPSRYMVRLNNKWRRVYHAIWGNIGTAYVTDKSGKWLIVEWLS